MWVECTVRIKARKGIMSGEAVAAALKTDMAQLRRSSDRAYLETAKNKYKASEHFDYHYKQDAYVDSVLGESESSGQKVFWLSGPTSRTEATLIKVAQINGSAVQANAFALRVYTELEKAIPDSYSIVSNDIRIEDVDHQFRVVRPRVAFPWPELLALGIVAGAWTVLEKYWTKGSWLETFMNGVLINAAFAAISVFVYYGYRVVRARWQRKVEYYYG